MYADLTKFVVEILSILEKEQRLLFIAITEIRAEGTAKKRVMIFSLKKIHKYVKEINYLIKF